MRRQEAEDSEDQKSLHLSYILGKTTDGAWPGWADDQEQVCANVTASGQVWNSGCASSSFGMSVLKGTHLNHIEGESYSRGSVNNCNCSADSASWTLSH